MMAYGMLSDDSTLTKGWCKSFKDSPETPAVQFFPTDNMRTSSGHQWESVRDV
ncbi:hypothetical protein DPMN_122598 [Dreissena polymorpha]|uniref:Uncharacterized protein n=1 Tax=Dreissena polymorpha TaxID=45954 RepID=A0A9D4JS56_DREPO|nr:hypothetical protein DPMN_122476 [Dreissena polymorpha]KAH3820849.1 hypothetical protein DPMN_122598 [Dreissena polymorpha]